MVKYPAQRQIYFTDTPLAGGTPVGAESCNRDERVEVILGGGSHVVVVTAGPAEVLNAMVAGAELDTYSVHDPTAGCLAITRIHVDVQGCQAVRAVIGKSVTVDDATTYHATERLNAPGEPSTHGRVSLRYREEDPVRCGEMRGLT